MKIATNTRSERRRHEPSRRKNPSTSVTRTRTKRRSVRVARRRSRRNSVTIHLAANAAAATAVTTTAASMDHEEDSFDLSRHLGVNASIPYAAILSSPACRPLEFPAPTVDAAVTVPADVIDHRSGMPFRATSVLMERPTHARDCGRASPNNAGGGARANKAGGVSTFEAVRSAQYRKGESPDRIHAWHRAYTAPATSPPRPQDHDQRGHYHQHHRQYQDENIQNHQHHHHEHRHPHKAQHKAPQPRRQHRRSLSLEDAAPCGPSCDLPSRAYCVVGKICNTTYGSIRLCVVLKRVSRHVANYARKLGQEARGFDSVPEGSSGEGREFVPEWETTHERVAVKVVSWTRFQSLRGRHLEDPIKELAAVQQLLGNYHPNVVSILDALQDERHLYCVFPYAQGGDLCGALLDGMEASPTGRIDEETARNWFRQILSGIDHLQKKGVCHRDICLENILVSEDGKKLQIADFGACLRVPFADPNGLTPPTDASANTPRRPIRAQGQRGRLEYMAPETLAREGRFDGFAVDLWAAGILLFELLAGKKPFGMPSHADANFRNVAVEGDLAGLLRSKGIGVSEAGADLLQNMLWCEPERRYTLAEIVDHAWVRGSRAPTAPAKEIKPLWLMRDKSIHDEEGGVQSLDATLEKLMADVRLRSFTAESTVSSLVGAQFLDDACSSSSTVESVASTVCTSDAESQLPLSTLSSASSDHPTSVESAQPHDSQRETPHKVDPASPVHVQKKWNRAVHRLKWWRSDKAATIQ